MSTVLVTGGAGFIGSALVRHLIAAGDDRVVTLDKLTYAGSLLSLAGVIDHPRHRFVRGDICDPALVHALFDEHRPGIVVHLAAESHVDRSIDAPADFVQTNLVGTHVMLEASRRHRDALDRDCAAAFRFLHVSTDEVYGSLGPDGSFSESTPYDPSSPYAASKAGADHLVRAWHRTYALPVLITNCSNNFGPFQFPDKLIPLMIQKAIAGEPLPIYGNGENVRDWLYVDDHVRALRLVLDRGNPGATYNIGGNNERRNIDVVRQLCRLLDELRPDPAGTYERLISHVDDRPGHDLRYAIDATRARAELGWRPEVPFDAGLRRTVEWCLARQDWVAAASSGSYRGQRLGLGGLKYPPRQGYP